jgi:hypothetical protein
MFISWSKRRHVDGASCLIITGHDGRTADSISGEDDGTYASHMAPLTAGMLGLPYQPCSGPQKLIAGDYYFAVAILGVCLQ